MSLQYVVRRVLLFLLIIWVGTSLIFFLPKLAPNRDPVAQRLGMLAATGGVNSDEIDAMVEAYRAKFGLDLPVWRQYLNYMGDMLRFDFNYSLAMYPATVIEIIGRAVPWSVGLLAVSTFFAFLLGSLLGGLLGWPRTPKIVHYISTPFLMMSSVPYYLLGLIVMYIFAFKLKWLPLGGGSQYGTMPSLSWTFIIDVVQHAILPALSMVIAGIGFWALSMRGMMVTTLGEDYVMLAEARGLSPRRIFFRYAMRNAILPQTTGLALSAGTILSGSLLVEVIFRYPGMGSVLYRAITSFDFFMIYGVVFFVVLTVGLATLMLDLIYPFLDPRIRYSRQ
jgi:peptide/nickel transport system permease protein